MANTYLGPVGSEAVVGGELLAHECLLALARLGCLPRLTRRFRSLDAIKKKG